MAALNKKAHLSLIFFFFFNKSVNTSLEQLIQIKVIFILKQEMLRQQNLKKNHISAYITFSAYMRAV